MVGVGHDDGRLAVLEDVGDLVAVEAGVDRHGHETGVPDGEQRLEVLGPVAHHDGHPVTGRQAEVVAQASGRAGCSRGERAPARVDALAIGQRRHPALAIRRQHERHAVRLRSRNGLLTRGPDRLGRRDPRWWLRVPALSVALCLPFLCAICLVASPWLALALAVPNLFVLPFGTALAIYAFWVLLHNETRSLFEA